MPKAVAVDYQSMVKKPADFDAFWDGVLQQRRRSRWSLR